MHTFDYQLRVRYAETDRMGYVYYGNYAAYFEVARVEMLRSMGITYKALEDSGILLPVAQYEVKYHKPAYYDDVLNIRTYIHEKPNVRLTFDYETYNAEQVLLNTAKVVLVFLRAETMKPMQAPAYVLEKFS